jgi:hypothetical protein
MHFSNSHRYSNKNYSTILPLQQSLKPGLAGLVEVVIDSKIYIFHVIDLKIPTFFSQQFFDMSG